MPTNLTDRLGELIGRVEYILDPAASAEERMHRRQHLTNADLREILSALRKAEQPAATNAGVEHITGTLVGDLRACATSGSLYAAAADEIERQAADLRTYAKTMDMIGQITPSGDYTELVERLGSHMGKADIEVVLSDCREAATAIERLTADRDLWKQSEETCSRQHDLRAAEVERLTAREAELCEALRPFAAEDFETPVSDENGWTETGISWCRERIVDWFGPSDFLRARLSIGDEK